MATDAIGNTTGSGTGAVTQSQKASASLGKTLDDFLKLLTTQLKNQDPTAPLDTSQFTQQIAQLASVEQQINTNSNLEGLSSMFATSQINGVVGYIGKRIEAGGNTSTLDYGQALFVYELAGKAKTVDLSISDENGNVVFSGKGDTLSGRNAVYWNGVNSFNGQQMPDGVYTLTLKARGEQGEEIVATTYSTGRVTSVDIKDGKPTLLIGTYEVPLDKVRKISEDPLAAHAA